MRTSTLARAAHASALICLFSTTAAIAANASAPDRGAPQKTAAQTQTAPPPKKIPLNSGISPQEFPADPSKVTVEVRPNGVRAYHMNGQGVESVVAHVGKNGKIEYTCTDQADATVQVAPAQANSHEH
jgi:hypothetical protein